MAQAPSEQFRERNYLILAKFPTRYAGYTQNLIMTVAARSEMKYSLTAQFT